MSSRGVQALMTAACVYEIGRWRISVRFGRYRFGLHRTIGWSAFSWGLGFCTGNAVRRNR